jgi:hypothetical protein
MQARNVAKYEKKDFRMATTGITPAQPEGPKVMPVTEENVVMEPSPGDAYGAE